MSNPKRRIILFRPTASESYRQGEVPVQLLAIARMIPEHFEISLVCSEVGLRKKTTDEIRAEIDPLLDDCYVFGVTAMTGYGIKEALDVSQLVREKAPEATIVWGGWHASLLPEQTLENPYIDFVIKGMGEYTSVEFLEALESGATDFSGIQGLGWKRDGHVIMNPPRPMSNISDFPHLPYHLIEDDFFNQIAGIRSASYLTSVGCPLDCGFCADKAVYQGKWNRLSAERCLEELKGLRDNYGVTAVHILDSNFFVHWPRGIEILTGMRELGMRAIWVNARIPRLLKASPEDLELFRDTVDYFLVGAESGSDETLKMVTKLQTVADIRKLAIMYAEARVPICFSTLVGVPYEDNSMWEKEFDLTIDLMSEILRAGPSLHTTQMHLYTPDPGTPLYKDAVQQGFVPPTKLEDWVDIEMFTTRLPYLPEGLGGRVEFITTYIMQSRRPDYKFYRGTNPFAKAAFGTAQSTLSALFRLRWKYKFFSLPIEMKLIESVLARRRKMVVETY